MTEASGIVTLLTDFGLEQPFVGVMKGVMSALDASLRFVDLAHALPAHDVEQGAFWLAQAAPWFPPGTTHLCVVDPGVGTARRALVAEAGRQFFVGPDNGILSRALETGAARVFSAPVPPGASNTFHGRDVFAPLAAALASGRARPEALGAAIDDYVRLPSPAREPVNGEVVGQVVCVDRFGNLLSDVRVPTGWRPRGWVRVGGELRLPLVANYLAGGAEPAALVNSWGVVELFVARGRASELLGLSVGASVALEVTR